MPCLQVFRSLVLLVASVSTAAASESASPPSARGGRVSWGRLIVSHADWGAHSDRDPQLAAFIRAGTSLNINPDWHMIAPGDFPQLCAHPFVYTKDVAGIRSGRDVANVQQYLQRGGFVCIDPCVNSWSASRKTDFIRQHAEWFARLVPGSVTRLLPENHALFHCYFDVKIDDLFTPDMLRAGASKPPDSGLFGVFLGERMIAAICTDGLECGWPQTPQRTVGCMRMIVNIYVYAMTRDAALGAK
jgi:hypothetical protein